MSEPGSRRGRAHDAEGAREAILNAAEEVFAEHGFDGARIDAIAELAGYNKSLIFHYYGDKLALYRAVLQRLDRQGAELQAGIIGPLLADEGSTSDPDKFRTFLGVAVRLIFDLLIENPRMTRMLAWEAAEGWHTYRKIASQFNTEDVKLFRQILGQARDAGLIRSGIDPAMVFSIAYATCVSYLNSIPLMEMTFDEEDLSSQEALIRAREIIVEFVIHGIMVDPEGTKRQVSGNNPDASCRID
ncbi:MAG: TetR family transcriptional regulator [Ktedonobacteraceae bacterium]|nr:TetR family transcriptional regulator [Ktedonobacteraceae bacterium]